jgi:hypothetical protein
MEDQVRLYGPDGRPFVSMLERARQAEERRRRAERRAAQLRALGNEPET